GEEIKAITDHIILPENVRLLATTQHQIETTIAFLYTHFTFRGIPPYIINIPKLPAPKWELFNNYVPNK
ncbi:25145_t:CDS:1, partial [Dentiscutata erythropus]